MVLGGWRTRALPARRGAGIGPHRPGARGGMGPLRFVGAYRYTARPTMDERGTAPKVLLSELHEGSSPVTSMVPARRSTAATRLTRTRLGRRGSRRAMTRSRVGPAARPEERRQHDQPVARFERRAHRRTDHLDPTERSPQAERDEPRSGQRQQSPAAPDGHGRRCGLRTRRAPHGRGCAGRSATSGPLRPGRKVPPGPRMGKVSPGIPPSLYHAAAHLGQPRRDCRTTGIPDRAKDIPRCVSQTT